MKKRENQKFKVRYTFIPNDLELEQSFRILSEHFYKNQEKIKEKVKEYEKYGEQSSIQSQGQAKRG